MAGARSKNAQVPVGSTTWIHNEREHAQEAVRQDAEEFSFSVRNELEWLNEHMAEIFSQNQMSFADIFKTPGKLRGKTPRTTRKHHAPVARAPLTDIFAPSAPGPSSAQKSSFLDKVAQFQIAEDVESRSPAVRSRSKSPQRVGQPGNTDSGYHGMMTEDEMELDNKTETATTSSQQSTVQKIPLRENQPPPQRLPDVIPEVGDSSNDSFTSAREELTRNISREQAAQIPGAAVPQESELEMVARNTAAAPAVSTATRENAADAMEQDQDLDAEMSRSDASSPEKPLQRKSSFTFTALPAREPLTAKRSLGVRNSQLDARESTLGKPFGAKGVLAQQDEADTENQYVQAKSEASKAHNKTSTQLLHERITMLGKTKELRPSKSIPQNLLASQPSYPQLPASETIKTVEPAEDSDDDWIAPKKVSQRSDIEAAPRQASPDRPAMHQKSVSTTQIPSPSRPMTGADARQQKAVSVSNPSFNYVASEMQSTTPAGSPSGKKSHEGPISASKNKLYSVLKSAKSIFASSASASAAAKLEAHNNSPSRSPRRDFSDESKTAAVFNMPGALYSDKQLPRSPPRPISIASTSPSKKSRKSDESERKREKDLKAHQKADEELEKAREKERQRAAKQREEKERAQAPHQQTERPTTAGTGGSKDADMPPPPPPKNGPSTGKLRAPLRVGGKPMREPAAAKPAPVTIRVPSQSQRLGQNLSRSQHESSAPPPPPKQNSTRPGSAQGSVRSSTAPNNSRVKALAAAAKKKEADERAAQEKAEKKLELERKRAAKVEEERKAEEERRAAEQQRAHEAKLVAQRQAEKQAADAKRREQQRLEQVRQQEEAQRRQREEAAQEKARTAHELAEAIKRERAQQPPPPARGDVGGTLRQLTKSIVPEQAPQQARPPQAQPNPARPPKRVWAPEDEEDSQQPPQPGQPQRPGMQRAPPSYTQNDAKRRRTNEGEEEPVQRHSVMAPPMRFSNMRKESTLAKFPHGYAHAPPPATHHVPGMFKAAVNGQHQLQQHASKPGMPTHPSQMVQVSNARIPFAENANPPAAQQHAQHHPQSQLHPGFENIHPAHQTQNKYKTPARPAQLPQPSNTNKSAAKSSPLYLNGDAIQLPEIATDSEDEESDDDGGNANTGFRAPSWVASPALRELLTQQQLVDPESVFGPIGELKMDEVFKNAKNPDRLKRLRDRGSSAAWIESGDAVTSAEKRRDMEARERVVREGGWRYEPHA